MSRFLREMDARLRRERIDTIYNYRISQYQPKDFRETMRRLAQEDRMIRLREARMDGRLLWDSISDEEAEALDRQGHQYLSDMSQSEKERFLSQQNALWAMIPPEHRAKAEAFARGH